MNLSRVIVPVSGGKDSQVCVALAIERYGREKVFMAHQNTGFDHSVTYAHMLYMQERYQVPLIQIHSHRYGTVPDVMVGERVIPTRHARACTKHLKTRPWFAWLKKQEDRDTMLVWLGMRAVESVHRKANYGHLANDDVFDMGDISSECPALVRKVQTMLPIVEWTTPAVFEFLQQRGDKVNPLYSKGHKRVGCYPCVLAGKADFRLAARDPEGRAHIEQVQTAIIKIQAIRPEMVTTDFMEHDLEKLLNEKEADPFGLHDDEPEEQTAGGCSWCNL